MSSSYVGPRRRFLALMQLPRLPTAGCAVLVILSLLLVHLIPIHSRAQEPSPIPVDILAGNKGVNLEGWMYRRFGEDSHFSFFNYTQIGVPWESRNKAVTFINGVVIYEFTELVGVAGGGYVTGGSFVPTASLSFSYEREDLSINVFPTIELVNRTAFELFLIGIYRPKITEDLRGFAMVATATNFSPNQHNFSSQNIRIGIDLGRWQLGPGVNFEQIGSSRTSTVNAGVFLRHEFR